MQKKGMYAMSLLQLCSHHPGNVEALIVVVYRFISLGLIYADSSLLAF